MSRHQHALYCFSGLNRNILCRSGPRRELCVVQLNCLARFALVDCIKWTEFTIIHFYARIEWIFSFFFCRRKLSIFLSHSYSPCTGCSMHIGRAGSIKAKGTRKGVKSIRKSCYKVFEIVLAHSMPSWRMIICETVCRKRYLPKVRVVTAHVFSSAQASHWLLDSQLSTHKCKSPIVCSALITHSVTTESVIELISVDMNKMQHEKKIAKLFINRFPIVNANRRQPTATAYNLATMRP